MWLTAREFVVVPGAVPLAVAHFVLLDAGRVVGAQKVRRHASCEREAGLFTFSDRFTRLCNGVYIFKS